jgi:hypothetical protein
MSVDKRLTPDSAMSFDSSHSEVLRELQEQIHRAHTVTPELMADVMARACPRLHAQQRTAKAKVVGLIDAGAFADAALALLDLELPRWKLRRLIREDDEWHCSVSRQLGLPAELDDMAEGNHESLPLAVLGAFVEARRRHLTADESRPGSVPLAHPVEGYAICSDNFA